ncbi:nucleotidyltransferase family protein [Planctomycetota bacterium]
MSPDPGILGKLKQELPYLRKTYSVSRLALFGSASKGELAPESDVDIVIEFERPLGLKFIELCDYIEGLLGRKVDVLTLNGLDNIRVKSVAENIRKDLVYV